MICTSEVKSNSETKRKFHQYVQEDVMKLRKRLALLEEEINMMKQEMFHNTAERKTLMNEVYQQLKDIQFSLHPENQSSGHKFYKKQEGGRSDGLSQVLYEDMNPSLVTRGVSGVAAPGASETTVSNFLCIEFNN